VPSPLSLLIPSGRFRLPSAVGVAAGMLFEDAVGIISVNEELVTATTPARPEVMVLALSTWV
jgi:hypothetical protein